MIYHQRNDILFDVHHLHFGRTIGITVGTVSGFGLAYNADHLGGSWTLIGRRSSAAICLRCFQNPGRPGLLVEPAAGSCSVSSQQSGCLLCFICLADGACRWTRISRRDFSWRSRCRVAGQRHPAQSVGRCFAWSYRTWIRASVHHCQMAVRYLMGAR